MEPEVTRRSVISAGGELNHGYTRQVGVSRRTAAAAAAAAAANKFHTPERGGNT